MSKLELLSVGETNAILKRASYLVSDLIARRGTEGRNPLIPRQEYEVTAGLQALFGMPGIYDFVADKVGMDGLRKLGNRAQREIGTKITNIGANTSPIFIALCAGRAALICGDIIKPSDAAENVRTILSYWKAWNEGYRHDGRQTGFDAGYVTQILDQDVVEKLANDVEPITPENKKAVQKFNAAAQMQGFLMHFDNRLGLGDNGPYEVGDKVVIVRDLYVNEKIWHWADTAEGLPFSYTMIITMDKKKMMEDRKSNKLKFFSLYDAATFMADPFTYEHDAMREVAVYSREDDELGVPSVRVPLEDLPAITEKIEAATIKLYMKIMKMSMFERMLAGMWIYYVGLALPPLRAAGLYDEACVSQGLWDLRPEVMIYLPQIMQKAATIMPKAALGFGVSPIPMAGFE